MKSKAGFQIVILVVLSACMQSPLNAAKPTSTDSIQRLSFRTQKKATAHFNDEKSAASIAKTLHDLGCETKTAKHNGHIDVSYECKYWRSLKVKSNAEVAQWETWLASKGFFVVHNTPAESHQETVQYQLANWKTYHFKPAETAAYIEMFKMLGCEVTTSSHGDHMDVKVRCATWQNLGLPNHQEAHAWMGVLNKLGFKTLHEH